jgi:hypothetical protein
MIATPLVPRRRRGTLVKSLLLVGLLAALAVMYGPAAIGSSCDPPRPATDVGRAATEHGGIVVVSAGPDGQLATADDIRVASKDAIHQGRVACC